ncbi:MAG: SDR family oxidoreductase, partial [Pseudorhodobacter sp.]|nr:SDR family oxidoreductase [Pseudorhodobacter sp.]
MTRRVLITAGASGIGLVMARSFAASGARVWVSDVDASALAALPPGIRGSRVDVADEGAMAALFGAVKAEWGGLDVLCANAGIKGPTAAIEDVALTDWRACLAVGLDGAFLAAKYATPMMKQASSGVMLFTSSTAGIYGFPFRAPYAAAKWAVIGLMKTVAMELGPYGIRANAIVPGNVDGPRMDAVLAAEAQTKGMTVAALREGYEQGTALRSFVAAQDVADMALFLASNAARMVSGQALAVDAFT